MNIVDKILIAILVVLLPVGIYFSRNILMSSIDSSSSTTIDVEKLTALVEDYERLEKEARKPIKQFVISNVTYASESGDLKIEGNAPESTMTVMMSATVLSPPKESDTADGVLGSKVEHYSVIVRKDGTFSALIPIKDVLNIVELRLEQNDVVKTIRYDLSKNKWVF